MNYTGTDETGSLVHRRYKYIRKEQKNGYTRYYYEDTRTGREEPFNDNITPELYGLVEDFLYEYINVPIEEAIKKTSRGPEIIEFIRDIALASEKTTVLPAKKETPFDGRKRHKEIEEAAIGKYATRLSKEGEKARTPKHSYETPYDTTSLYDVVDNPKPAKKPSKEPSKGRRVNVTAEEKRFAELYNSLSKKGKAEVRKAEAEEYKFRKKHLGMYKQNAIPR